MEMLTCARPTLMSLFKSLTSDTKTFIRQEVQLAKTELSEKISRMGKNAAMVAVGGFVAYAGVIVFLIGLGWLLAWVLEAVGVSATLARFIGIGAVGLIVALVGYLMLNKALKALMGESLAPERTMQTLQDLKGAPAPESIEEGAKEKLSSEQLQQRVEATETRMGDTLEELGYHLSPRYISERVKTNVSENPYRAGLVAMGVGLLSGLVLRRKFASHAAA